MCIRDSARRGPQRPLPLRQRAQVQELPRAAGYGRADRRQRRESGQRPERPTGQERQEAAAAEEEGAEMKAGCHSAPCFPIAQLKQCLSVGNFDQRDHVNGFPPGSGRLEHNEAVPGAR